MRYLLELAVVSVLVSSAPAQIITTIAGADFLFTGDGGPALDSTLGATRGIATDSHRNIYLADLENNIVVKVSPDGILTVISGNSIAGFSGDNGPANRASLNQPIAVHVDQNDNLYVSDSLNYRIRKVTPDGVIRTIAGTGVAGYSGDGGPALRAAIYPCTSMTSDGSGNVYCAGGGRIRKIASNGTITTLIGSVSARSNENNSDTTGEPVFTTFQVAADQTGNLYIYLGETGFLIRQNANGQVVDIAGNGRSQYTPDGSRAQGSSIGEVRGLAIDSSGSLYFSEVSANRVRRIGSDGLLSTFAGGTYGFSGDSGPARNAALAHPQSLAFDGNGNLFIEDRDFNKIRRIGPNGIISTIIAGGSYRPVVEGTSAIASYFYQPDGLAFDETGSLYVSDKGHHRVRKINSDGKVTTVTGTGIAGYGPDNSPSQRSAIISPKELAFDSLGNLFIADPEGQRVRKISSAGTITTVAGNGEFAGDLSGGDGPAFSLLVEPEGVAISPSGELYIADTRYNSIRKLTKEGLLVRVAGTAGPGGFSGDGSSALAAQLNLPSSLAFDSKGNLFFADQANQRIRKIAANGVISTFAGTGVAGYSGDGGPATKARLGGPHRIAVDPVGSVYIAEFDNHTVRKVAPDGVISTIAGTGKPGFFGDGGLAINAMLNHPSGIAVDPSGRVYISDGDNHRIRVVGDLPPRISAVPQSLSFTATSDGLIPPEKAIDVTSPVSGLAFAIAPRTVTGGAWLRTSVSDSATPASTLVSVNPSGLAAGVYQGSIELASPNANPPLIAVPVSFTVQVARPPKIGIDTQRLSFSFLQQTSPPSSTNLAISNLGGGALNVSAQPETFGGGNWLSVSPASANATANSPASFTIAASPGDLLAGTYSGSITLASSTSSERVSIPVTMTIARAQSRILLSQAGVSFTSAQRAGGPLPQSIGILNTGNGSMNWVAQASTLSGGASWLKISTKSGTVNQAFLDVSFLDVIIDATGLDPGDYYGRIQVSAPGADNSPQILSVILNVLPPGSYLGPEVRPTGLIFTGIAGGSTPGSQRVMISNRTEAALIYGSSRTYVGGGNWFVHLPTDASVAPSEPGTIVVQPNFAGLSPGIRRGALSLAFGDGSLRSISVLNVLAPADFIAKDSYTRFASGCAATQLLPQITSLSNGFAAQASQPTTIQVKVVDNCGTSITGTGGSVVARFSNRDDDLYLNHIKDGLWSGSWQPRELSSSQVQVVVDAYSGTGVQRVGGRTNPLSGTIGRGANIPVVAQGGVVNGATFVAQAPVAPGSLITIFGSQLADASKDTSVMFGGKPMPLFYVSDVQLNAQVPYDLAENSQQQLLVRRGTALSIPQELTLAPAQPGIYTLDQSGIGQGVIVNGVTNVLAQPGTPVSVGDTIVIYGNGLGAVNPPVAPGTAATGLSRTTNPTAVTIGGLPAKVDFAGLAPGFAGLYQINAVIPAGVVGGDKIPVMLSVAGQVSPAVTIAVR